MAISFTEQLVKQQEKILRMLMTTPIMRSKYFKTIQAVVEILYSICNFRGQISFLKWSPSAEHKQKRGPARRSYLRFRY